MRHLMLVAACLACGVPTAASADEKPITHPEIEVQVSEATKDSVITTKFEALVKPEERVVLPDHPSPETVIQFTPEPDSAANKIYYPFLLIKQEKK